ncbi:MAG: hypothetical protein V1733_01545 [bacterium]
MPGSSVAGGFWLLTAILFLLAAALYLLKPGFWWIPGAMAVMLSQILIILSWKDARFGTIANVIILLPEFLRYTGAEDSFTSGRLFSVFLSTDCMCTYAYAKFNLQEIEYNCTELK